MIVNRFGMRSNVLTFNLGGMGCSASPISIDLAKRLFRDPELKNQLCLVVSTENIRQNWYRGNERSVLLQNTLVRCGAAAILLSNRAKDAGRARFRLLHTVRTHTGQSDECYGAVFQQEDDEGIKGVKLSKQIMQIAGDTLKIDISSLDPLVLPIVLRQHGGTTCDQGPGAAASVEEEHVASSRHGARAASRHQHALRLQRKRGWFFHTSLPGSVHAPLQLATLCA
eukprot:TRINITY_DN13037_c0_g2_i1.p1 TRINITY_DN13037_c0_g2~~TRINITY_DN13037_c0_g2_i1.p1  ORF type:complete len:226 (-),score=50.52 TRINITY_DN13037_c0_g2_i1:409-1086(-)